MPRPRLTACALLLGIGSGIALLGGCATDPASAPRTTASVPEASVFEYRQKLASLPARDPVYQTILERLADPARTAQTPENQRVLAYGYITRALALTRLSPPDYSGAAADYRRIMDQFDGITDPEIAATVARAFLNLGVMRLRLGGDTALTEKRALYAGAIERAKALTGDDGEEITATALYNQGLSLLVDTPQDRPAGFAALEAVVSRFRASKQAAVQERLLMARVEAARAFGNTPGEEGKAIPLAEDALTLAEGMSLSGKDYYTADALLQKGYALYRLGREKEALAIADDILNRFTKASDIRTRRVVSRVALNLVYVHRDASPRRTDAQRAAVRDFVTRFGTETDPLIVARLAEALGLEGDLLSGSTPPRYEEALDSYLAAYRRLERLPLSDSLVTRHEIAIDLGRTYAHLNRPADARTYLDISDKLAAQASPSRTEELTVRSLSQRVLALVALNSSSPDEINGLVARIEQRVTPTSTPFIISQHFLAYENQLRFLARTQPMNWPAALAIVEPLLERYSSNEAKLLQPYIARASVNRALARQSLPTPQVEEALADIDRVVQRFGSAQDPAILFSVARGLSIRQRLLETQNRPAEAKATAEDIVQRFDANPDPRLQEYVRAARQKLNALARPVTG